MLVTALGPGPVGRLAAGEVGRVGVQIVDTWAAGADLSVSAITVLAGTGERSVVSRNAHDLTAVVPADLADLVADADVMLIDGHHPDLALTAAQAARAIGVPVVLDCGSAKPVYAGLVPLADAAVCSAGFTASGCGGFDAVSAALLADGARLVAMTAGAAPVRWRTREATGTVDVPSVTVRDTLGAGDVLHVGPRSWLDDQRLAALVAGMGWPVSG
ncbi:MAG: PfkB family carbohydrate kinase [Pseudonocardiaceae bacterium]